MASDASICPHLPNPYRRTPPAAQGSDRNGAQAPCTYSYPGITKRVRIVLEIPPCHRHARHNPAPVASATAITPHKGTLLHPALTTQRLLRIRRILNLRTRRSVTNRPLRIPHIPRRRAITSLRFRLQDPAPSSITIRLQRFAGVASAGGVTRINLPPEKPGRFTGSPSISIFH